MSSTQASGATLAAEIAGTTVGGLVGVLPTYASIGLALMLACQLLFTGTLHWTVLLLTLALMATVWAVAALAMSTKVSAKVAGPEQFRLDELIRNGLKARQDPREVVADAQSRYFGAMLSERTLVPADGAGEMAVGPELPAPQPLLHSRAAPEDLTCGQALDDRHHLAHAVGRHRLHEEMDVVLVRADLDLPKTLDLVDSYPM